MGSALLAQWIDPANGNFAEHRFVVIDPAIGNEQDSDRIRYVAEPPPIEESNFDLVIVAVKPQVLDVVLPDYAPRLAKGGFIASIAAGCSIQRLSSLAEGAPVVRIMPNIPAAIGAGVSGLCAGPSIDARQRETIQNLTDAAGVSVWVEDEDKLDRLTAIAGSGPGYVFEIARAYVEAAQELGFDQEEARELVLGTMAGTVAMARGSDRDLAELRSSVTSKNGTTQAGLEALNSDGVIDQRMHATLQAAYKRAVELR